jgi:hypothetical protein
MESALGYQPRTYPPNFLLSTVYNDRAVSAAKHYRPRGFPLATLVAHNVGSIISMLQAVSHAWLTPAGGGCQATFHQVTLDYPPSGDLCLHITISDS